MFVKTEDDRKKLIEAVLKLDLEKGPWIITPSKFKRDRSAAQRRLQHMWYTALGKCTGEGKEHIANYCKWTYGCPIVAEKHKDFAEFYDHMINHYTYEQCVAAMEYTQVTSAGLMDVAMNAQYLDHINAYAAERGCQLPQPEHVYYEAMGLGDE